MKYRIIVLILGALFLSGGLLAQKTPQEKGLEFITMDAIESQLSFLASDWTEGRETGTRGMYLASDYIASMLKFSGVPGGGDMGRPSRRMMARGGVVQPERTYFQNFTLLETLPGGESDLGISKGDREFMFQENVDYTLRASSSSTVSGELVFVGYGIQSDEFGINELSGADLEGKIAIRLYGLPGQSDENSVMYRKFMEDRMAAYTLIRNKDYALREMGALAVIDINLDVDIGRITGEFIDDMQMSPNESSRNPDFARLRLDDAGSAPQVITVSGGHKIAAAALSGSNIDLREYARDAAEGLKKFKPVDIRDTRVTLKAEVKKRRVNVRNVVAMIEGKRKDEFVVIGAHMDHMGMSGGRIWNGADDNASGTVGVMTIAGAFAATGVQPERTVLFCGWTGEEKGLLGSEYFSRNPVVSNMDNCKFYINFDMIARDSEDDKEGLDVGVTYNSNYPGILEMCQTNVEDYGLKMNYNYRAQENPRGGSDYTAFTASGVPIIAFMAAMHPDYHTPNDHVEFVNWDKMLDIIRLGFLNLWEVANAD
ncbi:MAG: M20/M25/M40 family metallo-hydrolase [Bacteroidales bacterium]